MILDIREAFISTKANENNILFKPFAMLRCEMLFNFQHSMTAFDLFSVSGVGDWKLLLQFEKEKAMDWYDSLCAPLITGQVGWAAKP